MMTTADVTTAASHHENRRELARLFCGNIQGEVVGLNPGPCREWLQAYAKHPCWRKTETEQELNQAHGLTDSSAAAQPACPLTLAKVLHSVQIVILIYLLCDGSRACLPFTDVRDDPFDGPETSHPPHLRPGHEESENGQAASHSGRSLNTTSIPARRCQGDLISRLPNSPVLRQEPLIYELSKTGCGINLLVCRGIRAEPARPPIDRVFQQRDARA